VGTPGRGPSRAAGYILSSLRVRAHTQNGWVQVVDKLPPFWNAPIQQRPVAALGCLRPALNRPSIQGAGQQAQSQPHLQAR